MSLFGKTNSFTFSLPMPVEDAYNLVLQAAEEYGKVKDENPMQKTIIFNKETNMAKNMVTFTASFSNADSAATRVDILADSTNGTIKSSVGKSYQGFMKVLSAVAD